MTLRLLLIRHGLSSYNLEKRIQGRNDLSTLTPEGIIQASRAGEVLKGINIHAIYSSPLQRASDTAKELIKNRNEKLDIIFERDLLEVDLGPWSGLTVEEVQGKFPDLYQTWKESPDELTFSRKDGTSYQPIKDLKKQAERFLTKIFSIHNPKKDQTIAIVGHNAILRCIILSMLKYPPEGFLRFKLDNSSISIFNIKNEDHDQLGVQIETLNNCAHLQGNLPPKGENARIILVRHGETDWNKEGRFQGQIDIPLNEHGEQQALAAAQLLKSVRIDKAFSSSMSRPKKTAKLILGDRPNINIQLENELIEIGHGLWEGKLESEITDEWSVLLQKWQESPELVQMPQGENINQVSSRANRCWRRICESLSQKETALVVAHDAVNKTILCNLLGLTNADIWKIKQGNGGITIVDIKKKNNENDVVTCLNITSHLGGVFDNTAQGAL